MGGPSRAAWNLGPPPCPRRGGRWWSAVACLAYPPSAGFRRGPGWRCGITPPSKAGTRSAPRGCSLRIEVRPGESGDLALIVRIQEASPEAAQWDVREYLRYDFTVALCDGRVSGFAVSRRLAEGESELLNLAVDPVFRRHGVARRLLAELTTGHPGTLWLEVRESNVPARNLYKSLGFH